MATGNNETLASSSEDANRSFDGFEDDEDREDTLIGEVAGDGVRRRYFSKVGEKAIQYLG